MHLAFKQEIALTEVPSIFNCCLFLVAVNVVALSSCFMAEAKLDHPAVSCAMAKTLEPILLKEF